MSSNYYEEALADTVLLKIKENKLKKKILAELMNDKKANEGFSERVYKLAIEKYYKENTIKKYIFLGIALALFTLLLFGFSASFKGTTFGIFLLIGSVVITVLLSMSVARFAKLPDEWPHKTIVRRQNKLYPYFFVFGLFLFGFLYYNHTSKQTNLLKKEGIITKGIILDGSSLRVKRSTQYSLDVKFLLKNEEWYFTTITVSEFQFKNSAKNQQVIIEYAESEPNVAKLLDREEYINRLKNKQ